LAEHPQIERAVDDQLLEAKAKKALSGEKKQKLEKGRVLPESAVNDFEKRLKKVATRGGKSFFIFFNSYLI
jgi:hypothetical protein